MLLPITGRWSVRAQSYVFEFCADIVEEERFLFLQNWFRSTFPRKLFKIYYNIQNMAGNGYDHEFFHHFKLSKFIPLKKILHGCFTSKNSRKMDFDFVKLVKMSEENESCILQ